MDGRSTNGELLASLALIGVAVFLWANPDLVYLHNQAKLKAFAAKCGIAGVGLLAWLSQPKDQ